MDLVHRGEDDTASQDDQKRKVGQFGKHSVGQGVSFLDPDADVQIDIQRGYAERPIRRSVSVYRARV